MDGQGGASVLDLAFPGFWDHESTLSTRDLVHGPRTLIDRCVIHNRRPQAGVARNLSEAR